MTRVSFQVADAIASLLANSEAVAAAAGVAPRVYLYALDPEDDSDPIVLVSPGPETHPERSDRGFQVVVTAACRPADTPGGNPAAAIARPDGVLVLGADAARIDSLVTAIVEEVRTNPVGALLAAVESETDTLDPSCHVADITFDFTEIAAFGDDTY